MKKRIVAMLLAAALCLGLCSCRGSGRYRVVKDLGSQEYSIGLRNGDSNYYYIDAALKELAYDGTVSKLSAKWFGDADAVEFKAEKGALSQYEYIAPRDFIIGCDVNSHPLCFEYAGGYTGFDVELAQAVCEKLGWAIKIQPIESEDAYVELNSGNVDCVWGGIVLTADAEYTVLSTYMKANVVIAGLSDNGGSLRNKIMYVSTSGDDMAYIEANERIQKKLGGITRIQGTGNELFVCLDKGDCQLIVTTDMAVDYFNSHVGQQ